jgi:Ca2+-binding RTX toxin-like protein
MLRRALLLPLLLAAAPVAVLAAPAGAATVSLERTVVHDPGAPPKVAPWTTVTDTVTIAVAPGEANRLAVAVEGDDFVVRDDGAPLQPGAGCAAAGGAVTCATEPGTVRVVRAQLGDADDRLELVGAAGELAGGAGADELVLGAGTAEGDDGDDVLVSTGGATLRGGSGADRLTGGPHRDRIDGGTGTDAMDGGDGPYDMVTYAGRTEPVTIDLTVPEAGAAGEHDAIAGFEEAEGGDGADLLRAAPDTAALLAGGGGDDVLEGGPLADLLQGGSGDDRIAGGAGPDTLEGYDGDDVLDAGPGLDGVEGGSGDDVASGGPGRDGMRDFSGHDRYHGDAGADLILAEAADGGDGDDELDGTELTGGAGDDRLALGLDVAGAAVDCGAGRDIVERPPVALVLPYGCERVTPLSYVDPVIPVRPVLRDGVVRIWLAFPCNSAPSMADCRVTATLRVDGRSFGTRTVRWRQRHRQELRWRVGRRIRRAIGRGALVRVSMLQREEGYPSARGGYSVRLTAPGGPAAPA